MSERSCLWPGCEVLVPHRFWGCRPHWYRLPIAIRDAIYRAYRPGQGVERYPSPDYVRAHLAACEWASAWERRRAESPRQGSLF